MNWEGALGRLVQEWRRRRLAPAGLAVLVVSTLPALAASSDCVSDYEVEPAVRIAACTRMIEDPTEPPDNRATAYYKRGSVFGARGDDDHAMADFDAVIALNHQRCKKMAARRSC